MQATQSSLSQAEVRFGALPLSPVSPATQARIVIDGVSWTGIRDTEAMTPFFTTSVGDNDVWLFAGSNGALCAGRRDPELAVFPYQTVDRILDNPRSSGALTLFLIAGPDGSQRLWEPWADLPAVHPRRRSLYKNPEGNGLCFEEEELTSGLVFRTVLSSCDRFGLVRECSLSNRGAQEIKLRCLDGWHRLVPPGVGTDMWMNFSCLAQAYMRHDRIPGVPMGVFTLNAAITDRAEPMEVQRAATAWATGLPADAGYLLSTRQVDLFRRGATPSEESEIRGETGAFLGVFALTLAAGQDSRWVHCLDTNLDHVSVLRSADLLRGGASLAGQVAEALRADRRGLRARLASSDALMRTGDTTGDEHHVSNTLFNIMRGGVLPADLLVERDGFLSWLGVRNKGVAQRHAALVSSWPENLRFDELASLAEKSGDAQLQRLAGIYLPLSFSRRHGDPSRPWNRFSIRLKNAQGRPVISWQGNWRDIFQNWEALALSFPTALPAMISSFLDASSADGYNPYRITNEGIDWEVPEPHNVWSHHGYWGDHQIVYLQRLLGLAETHLPGWIQSMLPKRLHVSVEIPYRIGSFADILRDPRNSVDFDYEQHNSALAREKELGTDGRLLLDGNSEPVLFSLAEKLLTPVLAKLSNLVPGGGIWLNTQRPEWNDANNALVGCGLSMVTVCQLRRHVELLQHFFTADAEFPCTEAGEEFIGSLCAVLSREAARGEWEGGSRYVALRDLGLAGERHRGRVYSRSMGAFVNVSHRTVRELLAAALQLIDESIRQNRREDGLWHSYNLLELHGESATIARLQPMLEGQVAVLGSGMLSGEEALALLGSLRASALYREDQHSYMLYPDRKVAPFIARNCLPAASAARIPLLAALVKAGDRRLLNVDDQGGLHFASELCNTRDLEGALERLAADGAFAPLVREARPALLQVWEEVFSHKSFLGRSGTMFGYEGLGSIYWHMVSKLLLAVLESHAAAVAAGASPEVLAGLAARYYDIRSGLGPAKSPARFGAFPTDPYSHSPKHRGAQQPGMTGQVKEELIARRGELGVKVENGCIAFRPSLLRATEFLEQDSALECVEFDGSSRVLALPARTLAFTVCQVPVVYHLGGEPGVRLTGRDGAVRELPGLRLDLVTSQSLFTRAGTVARIDVQLGNPQLL
jgi:hypothetical protein